MRLLELLKERVRKRQNTVLQAMAFGTGHDEYLKLVGEYYGYTVMLSELTNVADSLERATKEESA